MPEEKLSGKAGLDTTNFKTGIAAMNRELRVLESGFRASAAELGDWSKSATGLEGRIKTLTQQIDVQKQKVIETRAQYERIAAEKGATSRAAQDLEIKLNRETETLNKMQHELGDTNNALTDLQGDSQQAAQGVNKLESEEKQATRSSENFDKSMQGIRNTMKGLASVAATTIKVVAGITAVVAGAAVGLVAYTTGPASDLNETVSKTEVVFGDAADKVKAFGDTAAQSLGLSKNAALTAAGTYGNLFRAIGLNSEKSADMSTSLVQLAGDLASFNNLDPTEVLDKLRAGITGESEPLKSLGINMNEARLKEVALREGLIKQGDTLDAAAKAQAAYAIIMEDSTLAQGDFSRTSSGLANQQRIMAANFENLRAKVGGAFLPVVNELAKGLNDIFSSDEFNAFFEGLTQWLSDAAQKVEPFIALMGDAFKEVVRSFQLFNGDTVGAISNILYELGGTLEDVFGIKGANDFFSNLGDGFIELTTTVGNFLNNVLIPFVQQHADELRAALIGIGAALAGAGIIATIAGIVAAINPVTLIIAAIVAAVGVLSAAWAGNWGGIRDTLTKIWEDNLQPALEQLWDFLSVAVPAAIQTLSDYWTTVLLPSIQIIWKFMSEDLFPLFQAIGSFLDAVFNLTLRVLAGIFQNVLLPPLQDLYQFLQDNVFPIFQTIGDYISTTFQPVLETLADFFNNKLNPAFGGISDAISGVIDWLTTMADTLNNLQLPDWLTPGSPTPWEIGLVGINKAMQELNQQLPVLAKGLDLQPHNAVAGLSSLDQSVNSSVQVIGNVIIRGDTPTGSLGAALKGKRY